MSEVKSECESTSGLVCGIEAPLKKMGNIQSASIIIQSEILGKENRYNQTNIKPATRLQVQNVALNLSVLCSKTRNMEVAMQSAPFTSGSAVGFVQEYLLCDGLALSEGNFFVFKNNGTVITDLLVQVLDVDGNLIEALVLDTDFSFSSQGIELLRNRVIAGAVYLRITSNYNNTGLDEFNFLSEFKGPKYLYFKGTNYGEGEEEPLGVEIYKVLFSPVSQLDLISQGNYFLLNLTGQIELDYANQDLNLGGYFRLRRG